ncbi:MAG: Orotate phosphoribosyltransferase (Modular protein) [Nitrospira sp.]|nr:MAG: Orotate phosphoribosyltransferase (Modular protein) [Nitrospira sp.]
MKKAVMLAVVGIFMAMQGGLAMAANPDTGPGCGLGKLAWQNYPNQKTIGVQTMEATTNGSFGTQTFGISSGTSGCTNDGKFWTQEKVNVFAALNFDNLAQDMAQGQGEHLASLATLMGIPAAQQPAFFAMTQEKYASLMAAGETSPVALVKALNDAVATHPMLAQVSAK